MIEKALISGVVHQREETVYRVEGVPPARLFGTLAEAGVNVDTILHAGAEIVFSAPVEDRDDAERALESLAARWSARDDLGKVSLVGAGMKSHPGVAAKAFAVARGRGHRGAGRQHLADQDRVPRREPGRRPRRARAARGVRAWLALASASSAPPARSGRSRSSCCASAAGTTCGRSRPRGRPGGVSAASLVEEATPEVLEAGGLDLCLFSVGTAASRELVPHAVEGGAAVDRQVRRLPARRRRPARRARGERRARAPSTPGSSPTRTAARSR